MVEVRDELLGTWAKSISGRRNRKCKDLVWEYAWEKSVARTKK